MNRSLKLIAALFFLAALIPVLAQTKTALANRKEKPAAVLPAEPADTARGEKVFQQNCARCHNAPQGFPPQISGTILRHMRVRASLSATDEKALLRFMNP